MYICINIVPKPVLATGVFTVLSTAHVENLSDPERLPESFYPYTNQYNITPTSKNHREIE